MSVGGSQYRVVGWRVARLGGRKCGDRSVSLSSLYRNVLENDQGPDIEQLDHRILAARANSTADKLNRIHEIELGKIFLPDLEEQYRVGLKAGVARRQRRISHTAFDLKRVFAQSVRVMHDAVLPAFGCGQGERICLLEVLGRYHRCQ